MLPEVSGRILFVISQLDVGGTERHLAMLAPALVRRGWPVTVFSLKGDGPLRSVLESAGVDVVGATSRSGDTGHSGRIGVLLSAARALWRELRRRPAIVHFFLPEAYLVGAPLAALARVPARVMSRRSLNAYQASYPFVGAVEKVLHRTMSAVLGNSRSVMRELTAQEGVPARKAVLIYNGVDLSRFAQPETRTVARAALGLAPDSLVLTIVANLIPYKGHSDLLEALSRAKGQLPSHWRLLLIGRDDGIGAMLRQQVTALGLEGHVEFLGSRGDVPRLLAAADIGLLCSHQEGFSNALLEGMAAGLPMIATDVGGNGEAIADGMSGLLVPARQPDALSSAILRLADDPALRGRLGQAARERVLRDFSLEACIDRYEALYRALIAGEPVPALNV